MKLTRFRRIAFIFGNLFPDLNPLTYLITSGHSRIGGHNYSARKQWIQTLGIPGNIHGLWGWFVTGEKFHYLADAFTRPHNHEFECPSRIHVDYERRLHTQFMEALPKSFSLCPDARPKNFADWLKKTHAHYIQSNPEVSTDCIYIMDACKKACASIIFRNSFAMHKVTKETVNKGCD